MFMLTLIFCGVLATPQSLPGFWIFMYRVSPFTYLVSGMLAVGVANTDVQCAANEFLHFVPRAGQNCSEYLHDYISAVGGRLSDQTTADECVYCPIADTNKFLEGVSSKYSERWRNFGILWAYVIFNVIGALVLYWLVRVPKKGLGKQKKKKE